MRFLLLLLLSGCATYAWERPADQPLTVSVTWLTAEDVNAECNACADVGNVAACAITFPGACRIVAHEDAPDERLGHELRHCFGWTHGERKSCKESK